MNFQQPGLIGDNGTFWRNFVFIFSYFWTYYLGFIFSVMRNISFALKIVVVLLFSFQVLVNTKHLLTIHTYSHDWKALNKHNRSASMLLLPIETVIKFMVAELLAQVALGAFVFPAVILSSRNSATSLVLVCVMQFMFIVYFLTLECSEFYQTSTEEVTLTLGLDLGLVLHFNLITSCVVFGFFTLIAYCKRAELVREK